MCVRPGAHHCGAQLAGGPQAAGHQLWAGQRALGAVLGRRHAGKQRQILLVEARDEEGSAVPLQLRHQTNCWFKER